MDSYLSIVAPNSVAGIELRTIPVSFGKERQASKDLKVFLCVLRVLWGKLTMVIAHSPLMERPSIGLIEKIG
jgi:hypothetical protein